jgi:transposase
VSEKLVYIPARLAVRRTSRDKARCQDCGRISTAMQPPEAVKHGQFDASVLAHLIYRKFGMHLPIDRIREDWRRMGHELASSSAQTALERACTLLEPIYDTLRRQVLSSRVLHCDGTGLDRLLPDQPGKIRSQVRVYCTDGIAPITVYTFNKTKHAQLVRETLRPGQDGGFRGYLVSDFGSEHTGLYDSGDIIQSGCWQHVREYFVKARSNAPRAAQEALAYIGTLFDTEADSDDAFETHAERLARRRRESAPALEVFKSWMRRRYLQYLPDEPLRVAMQYVINHWTALRRFLQDGAVPIHNNLAERELGVVGRGRKNFLFTGSVEGGHRLAMLYTIVRTCQRNGVDPYGYLDTVLPRLSVMPANRKSGWRIDELLPMAFKDAEQHAQAG